MQRKNSFRTPKIEQKWLETNKMHKTRIAATLLATLLFACFIPFASAQRGGMRARHRPLH